MSFALSIKESVPLTSYARMGGWCVHKLFATVTACPTVLRGRLGESREGSHLQTSGLFLPAEIAFNLLWISIFIFSVVFIYRVWKSQEDPSERPTDYMDEG